MYGQKPQLPVNLYFGTQNADMNTTMSTKFVQQLCERLKWAYKTAQHITIKETYITQAKLWSQNKMHPIRSGR